MFKVTGTIVVCGKNPGGHGGDLDNSQGGHSYVVQRAASCANEVSFQDISPVIPISWLRPRVRKFHRRECHGPVDGGLPQSASGHDQSRHSEPVYAYFAHEWIV